MQSNLDHKVFLFISQNVFIITVVDLKNEIIYSKESNLEACFVNPVGGLNKGLMVTGHNGLRAAF